MHSNSNLWKFGESVFRSPRTEPASGEDVDQRGGHAHGCASPLCRHDHCMIQLGVEGLRTDTLRIESHEPPRIEGHRRLGLLLRTDPEPCTQGGSSCSASVLLPSELVQK